MRFVMVATVLLLSGCGNAAEEARKQGENVVFDPTVTQLKPTATSLAGVDFGKRVEAFGTEPYWQLVLEPGKIEFEDFSVEDGVKTAWAAVAPQVSGNSAVIETKTPKGEAVTITLTGESCLEVGEEEDSLPLAAVVKIGTRTLTGCAGQKLTGQEGAEADNAIAATAENAGI